MARADNRKKDTVVWNEKQKKQLWALVCILKHFARTFQWAENMKTGGLYTYELILQTWQENFYNSFSFSYLIKIWFFHISIINHKSKLLCCFVLILPLDHEIRSLCPIKIILVSCSWSMTSSDMFYIRVIISLKQDSIEFGTSCFFNITNVWLKILGTQISLDWFCSDYVIIYRWTYH